jgi:DNA repair exonuclease SbcCD nuclease subunit
MVAGIGRKGARDSGCRLERGGRDEGRGVRAGLLVLCAGEEGIMVSVRFLHTGDWHLGMGRHFLSEEALPRFKQARIDAIRAMAKLVEEEKCSFAVVCGDVWDSNHLDRRVAGRSLEALAAMPCSVYLLPGNHDPLDAGSIYKRKELVSRMPDNVYVLDSTELVAAGPGVEIVGVPWATKRPVKDLVADACAELEPRPGTLRICVAHGIVDHLSPDLSDPALISRAGMDAALEGGRIHYFALGDRHSVTDVGERIWYSGSPEPTAYVDVESSA